MSASDYRAFNGDTSNAPPLTLKNGLRTVNGGVIADQPIVIKESHTAVIFRTLLSGIGFTCDAYDLFIMNVVLVVMGCVYQSDPLSSSICSLTTSEKSLLATAVLIGSIIGQLLFGVLADYIGRRKGFIATLSLLIVGAALSAGSVSTPVNSIFWTLAIARFILGVGVGGEYPLSATVSSEASVQAKGRGRRVSLVFSMQGVGLILAPVVVTLLVLATDNYDLVWRLALGLGGFPGLCMLYFRFQMKETPVFAAHQSSAYDSEEKWADVKNHWKDLFATTTNWFLFDIIFYANSLFSSQITNHFLCSPHNGECSVHEYLIQLCVSTLVLGLCALPGYFVSVVVIDRIGRRNLQMLGFVGMAVSYVVTGLTMPYLTQYRALFYFVYGLSFFFCNCGPNVTTFVIPSEIFPTSIRATGHGFSAACGKAGAALGTALMPTLLASTSLPVVMYVSAGLSAFGAVFTYAMTRESQHMSTLMDGELEDDDKEPVVVEEGDEWENESRSQLGRKESHYSDDD